MNTTPTNQTKFNILVTGLLITLLVSISGLAYIIFESKRDKTPDEIQAAVKMNECAKAAHDAVISSSLVIAKVKLDEFKAACE